MKLPKRILIICGIALALAVGLSHSWILALLLYLSLEAVLAQPLPGCGANQLGGLAGELILRRALELVWTKRPLLKSISMGFRDIDTGATTANFGQKVTTRIKAIATVGNFGDPPTGRADVDVSVTINSHRQVYHQFTVQEYNSTNRDLVEESAELLAVAVGNDIIDSVATLWKPANYPGGKPAGDPNAPGTVDGKTTIGAAWNFTNTFIPIRTALAKRGVPDWGWFAVLNSDVWGGLLADSLVTNNLYNPDANHAIKTGVLPTLLGMSLMEYPALPGNAANVIGFAGSPSSTVYASRVPRNPEEVLGNVKYPGAITTLTDERTGFSVMASQWIDPDTLNCNTRLNWMAGFGVGNPICGQVLVSA